MASDPDRLEVRLTPKTLADLGTPSFLGRRQQHRDVDVGALVSFAPAAGHEWAGLALRLSEDNHYSSSLREQSRERSRER